jgi:Fe-S-cluster containining protein
MGKGPSRVAEVHRQIYASIPGFECIEGCTDCCGPVPWSRFELKQAGLSRPPPERADQRCPYSLAGNCGVHQARPLMCRLFGAVEDLRCPHGRGPLELLSTEQGHDLVRRYKLANRME